MTGGDGQERQRVNIGKTKLMVTGKKRRDHQVRQISLMSLRKSCWSEFDFLHDMQEVVSKAMFSIDKTNW